MRSFFYLTKGLNGKPELYNMALSYCAFGQKNGKFHRDSTVPQIFSKKICDFAKKHLLFFVKYAKIGMYEKSAGIASVLRVHALFS